MKRVIASLLVFVIASYCFLALMFPPVTYSYVLDDSNDKILGTFGVQDISRYNNSHIDDNGVIVKDGRDPYILFDGINKYVGSLVLKVAENKNGYGVHVFYDSGSDYSEKYAKRVYMDAGDTDCIIPIGSEIKGVGIEIKDKYKLDSLELHSATPGTVDNERSISTQQYIFAFASSLVIAVVFFVLELRFKFLSKFDKTIRKNRKRIITVVLCFFGCALVVAIAELILSHTVFADSGRVFDIYRFFLNFGSLFVIISIFFLFSSDLSDKPENAFLAVTLTLCMMMMALCPFGHPVWDTEWHYKKTLQASYIGDNAFLTEAEDEIMKPIAETFPRHTAYSNMDRIAKFNEDYKTPYGIVTGRSTIAHLLSGLFLAIGRLAGLPFYVVTLFGRSANALLYCFLCYFALKKLKSGKMIAAVIALIPTAMMLATNFSYDFWTNGLVLLGMAYFVGTQQEPDKPISVGETLVMCVSFMLACLPKEIYVVLCFIPFLMRRKKIKKPILYYAICTLTTSVVMVLVILRIKEALKYGGDTRGGSGVSAAGQISYIFGDTSAFAKLLTSFLSEYLSIGGMKNFIVNMGNVGKGKCAPVYVALMLITTFTDKDSCDIRAYTKFSKVAVVGLFFGMAAAIASALYIVFNPVGSDTLNGVQSRYIIPLLYPMLSIVGFGFKNKMNKAVYNAVILLACSGFLIYTIEKVLLPWMTY
ncbi:MAG: DUF2142 domain-containing protein [Clostridiales bacterium]|nr:DUF2142 domain-containing protein [Clostridiales bacterium]